MKNEDLGKRLRLTIAGETYYLIAVRCEDGGVDFLITVPDENRPTGSAGAGNFDEARRSRDTW